MESNPVIKTRLTCKIKLPKRYHVNTILAFHQRDSQAIAEHVNEHSLAKGLLWNNQPACLTIHFRSGAAQAQLILDGTATTGDSALLSKYLHRLLGLTQAIEEFEQRFQNHPELGPILHKQTGLRIPTTFSVFEAISWAIVLLRGFGWLDASLHDDIAVRRGLQKLLASPNKMSEKQVQQWLEQFSPWRALVAVHLWAFG
ncbi:MAG: AlkA N-terminal domain-containing protein, partial [Pseudomonadota bacterium]